MPEAATARRPSLRLLYGLAAVAVVTAGLRVASPLLVPLALSLFLAILSWPLLEWLLRRRVPAGIAVLATIFFASVLFFAGIATKFGTDRIVTGTLAVGTIVFLGGVTRLITLPFL